MHAKKIRRITRVLKYRRSCRRHVTRGHVEERNGEVIASDSRLRCQIRKHGIENSADSRITSMQDCLLPSLFRPHRSHQPDSSLLPGPLNPLSGWIIKRTMSPLRRTMGPPTYDPRSLTASNVGPTHGTLSGNECVTSPLESASTFAYRCPVLPPSFVSFPQVWNFFLTFLSRRTSSWSHRKSRKRSSRRCYHEIRECALRLDNFLTRGSQYAIIKLFGK